MASGSQELRSDILINAIASGFTEAGAEIVGLGNQVEAVGLQVDGVSRKLIDLGKDSLRTYGEYEQNMRDAEAAFKTGSYAGATAEVDRFMGKLGEAAQHWASTTRFTTADVSNSISLAAHAGLDYAEIMEQIPAAMTLAQAGSLDLSTAFTYVSKGMAATGTEMENTTVFIDQLVRSANLAHTNVDEMGEAMLRMGATAQYADNTAELFAMLDVLANFGTTGSEAGTLLRNAMIRLVTPTTKASDAMKLLGASSEEVNGALKDENVTKAAKQLESLGFSAYDNEGKLKPMIQIFQDMNTAMDGLTEDAQNEIFGAIFSTRSVTAAKNFMNAINSTDGDQLQKLFGQIVDSEGSAEKASDIMMDSYTGKMAIFKSQVEELQRTIGENLAPRVEGLAEGFGEIVNSISGMDDDKFDALVSGLSVVAIAGPGLMIAGTALRFLGTVVGGSAFVQVGLAAVAITAFAAALGELEKSNFEDKFGDMNLDTDSITTYVKTIGTDFKESYEQIDAWSTAVSGAVESYTAASSTLSSNLLTDMLTKKTLTEEDKTALLELGGEMSKALREGISAKKNEQESYYTWLMGGEVPEGAENDPVFALIQSQFESMTAEANFLAQGLRGALLSAFSDGQITDDEYQNILTFFQNYNDAIARASGEAEEYESRVRMEELLYKAQTASLADVEKMSAEIEEERAATLAKMDEDFVRERARYKTDYELGVEKGVINPATGQAFTGSEEERAAYMGRFDTSYQTRRSQLSGQYDTMLMSMWDAALKSSDLSKVYENAGWLADLVMGGTMTPQGGEQSMRNLYGGNKYAGEATGLLGSRDREQLGRVLATLVTAAGGQEGMQQNIKEAYGSGDTARGDAYMRFLTMEQLTNNFGVTTPNTAIKDWFGKSDSFESSNTWAGPQWGGTPQNLAAYTETLSMARDAREGSASGTADVNVTADGASAAVQAAVGEAQQAVSEQELSIPFGLSDSIKNDVVDDRNDTQKYLDGHPLKIDVNYKHHGKPDGGDSSDDDGDNSDKKENANGGRAVTAEIFGEAGPEWAIPEKHTKRTADLLNAARKASGFTWPELLAETGGLNANAGGGTTLVYSPTINAQDARGVDKALLDDKQRLERWWRERQMHEQLEVFA